MNTRIYLSPPHMSGKEIKYVEEAFATNWVAPLGPNVDKFEQELANYLNIKGVAALSSGTSAVHLALILLKVNPEDIVLCSSLTFCGSVNPVVYVGAQPVFIDSEKSTWNMDPELLEKAIKDFIKKGKKPKAIILVHIYGMPAKLDEIKAIAEKYEINLIEDAAEALGSRYKEKSAGTFGKIGILSFNGNKIITTSGGGALLSENIDYVKKAKFYATQAREDFPYYEHTEIGYNYRLSNVLAGIGRGQLEVLNNRISKKRYIHYKYKEELKNFDIFEFQEEPDERFFSNYWLTTILINSNKITNDDLRIAFENENIESRPLWKPMHLQPVFRNCISYTNGVSEKLFKKGLCLPSGTAMNDDDFNRIINVIKRTVKR